MDIYEADGELDLVKARAALDSTGAINNDTHRRNRFAELQIATLLDLAASLRVLALEAYAAMPHGVADADPDTTPVTDETRDFLVVGDLVHLIDDTEPGEVVKLGVDDGEVWAEVAFAERGPMKYYARNLERIVGTLRPADGVGLVGTIGVDDAVASLRDLADSDVPLVGVATEAETPALLTDADEDGEEAVGGYELDDTVDDIDADFDGAEHPNAEDALAKLKANEAARKAGKSKGKKK